MFSELKKLSTIFIFFSFLSCCFSLYVIFLLLRSEGYYGSDYFEVGLILTISISTLFICLAVTVVKIVKEVNRSFTNLYERIREIEKKKKDK